MGVGFPLSCGVTEGWLLRGLSPHSFSFQTPVLSADNPCKHLAGDGGAAVAALGNLIIFSVFSAFCPSLNQQLLSDQSECASMYFCLMQSVPHRSLAFFESWWVDGAAEGHCDWGLLGYSWDRERRGRAVCTSK